MTLAYKDQKFVMRGESMTRIETFVAASFAFATSMLVISLGTIPSTMNEFLIAVKNIPSFVLSCFIIFQIWHSHADWSRSYGLEDNKTMVWSGVLICIVLVYIYPLRLMMQGLFSSISNNFFPVELQITSYWDLRFLFAFYAIGFLLLSLNFLILYKHALSLKTPLELSMFEVFQTERQITHWWTISGICGLIAILAIILPSPYFIYTPYLFTLIFPANLVLAKYSLKRWERLQISQNKAQNGRG